ncbi:MAG: hypothetical protein ACLP6G_11075 [Terriglobales bacterium]
MTDSLIMAVAGVGAALMAASAAFSTGSLAAVGVGVIFVAAAWKYVAARKGRAQRSADVDRRHSEDRRVAVGSH